MPWISAGASLLGGLLTSGSNRQAAQTGAESQLESAKIAAEAAKFRPVGITTRYGTSNFQFNPQGYLTSAGYTVSPELQAYQNRLRTLTGNALTQAEMAPTQYAPLNAAASNLFSLGGQYLQQTPEQVAAQYMARQQDLLAPSRERQLSQLQNQLYQTGRGGLSVGGTGLRPSGGEGLRAASPEMEAYYNALAQQDAQLAAQAQQAGQQQVAFGTGLFGTGANLLGQYQAGQTGALSPFSTYLGAGSNIEQLGQTPLDIGAQLGGRSATAGQGVGQFLYSGGVGAANTIRGAAGSDLGAFFSGIGKSPELSSGISNWWKNTNFGFGKPATTPATGAAGYNISPEAWGNYYGQL